MAPAQSIHKLQTMSLSRNDLPKQFTNEITWFLDSNDEFVHINENRTHLKDI
jgi:hypothetical protein